MLVGIYKLDTPSFQKKINEVYKKILKHNNIPYVEISLDQPDFWDIIKTLDLFIFRWAQPDDHHQIASTILPIIENTYGVKCFPEQNTCWHYDDKIKEYYLFSAKGYPFIKSWIYWDKNSAHKFAQEADYPLVFKLKKGAGSSNVILIKNEEEACNIINKMFGKGISANGFPNNGSVLSLDLEKMLRKKADKYFLNKVRNIQPEVWQPSKNYVLFQKFLPNNSFDTRVTTIGDKVFANRRFVRKNDFRASGSGDPDLDMRNVDMRMVKIAQKISKEMNYQTMAYDFLLNENNEPEICEVSYTYADISVLYSPGYWDTELNWHEGNYWPEYFHIKDGLKLEELAQPEMDKITLQKNTIK